MAAARPRGGEILLHGEAAAPGLVAHLLAGEEILELDRPGLGPQPARRAEVRNAALGRNSGAGERRDRARSVDQFLQLVDGGRRGQARSCMLPPRTFCRHPMQRGHTMRYLHTMLRVRNLDQALDFYVNKLGLKEVAPPGGRKEPLHAGVPGGARRTRRGSKRASGPAATRRSSNSPTTGTARTTARRAISVISPSRSTTFMRYAKN